ncbi:MAG: tetratricopeptide repeat protein [Elusimicrobia bacterium]|nr:tetratricopeptide repeat protein [Elusimicrobiota bacterium]
MKGRHLAARFERPSWWEKLESPSSRFGWPFVPEYDLDFFRKLQHAELSEALKAAQRELELAESPRRLSERGRLRRVLGDRSGAARDLKRALDLEPDNAAAHAWLGELGLGSPESERTLSRAIVLAPDLFWAYLYRGAGRLLRGEARAAREDLERLIALEPGTGLGRLLLGAAEEKLGRRTLAVKAYAAAARAAPTCSAAYLLWSRAEADRSRSARACEKAFDADPDYAHLALFQYEGGSSWEAYLAGLRRFAFKEPERAVCVRFTTDDTRFSPYHFKTVERARRLEARRPRSAWAAALLGRAISRCPPAPGRDRAARRWLDRAVALAPDKGWPYAWRALALVRRSPGPALQDLNACLRLQPFYYRAHGWRGALLRRLGRAREGLSDLDRAVAADESYPFSVHERSLARRALGDFVGAALDLDRAFRLDFRYSWVYAVGRESSAAELADGLAELDRAVALHRHVPSLLVWRGQLRLQRREFSRAFVDFERAVHLDPHHALAHGWHGRGLVESGQPGAARAYLARAVELEPEAWIFQGWLAEAEFRARTRRSALKRIDAVLKARPKTWWAYDQRAGYRLEMGRPRQALADVRAALELEGRHVDGYYLEARVRLALSDLSGALQAVEKALTISPNLGRAYLLRARILEALGRHDGVLSDYRTVYEKFPYLFNEEQLRRVEVLLKR